MNVNLVTDILDFPNGTAGTMRVKMIGKALLNSGVNFTVYTNTIIHNKFNTKTNGIYDGIVFKYLHNTIKLEQPKIIKLLLIIKGLFVLNKVLMSKSKKSDIIYIYSHGSIFNLYTMLLCKLYKLKIVQEINEWDNRERKEHLKTFIFEGPMIKWANGAIVISNNIKEKVKSIDSSLKMIQIPVLDDPLKFQSVIVDNKVKYCFWMGQVDGYINDILLIIKACGIVNHRGVNMSFYICGNYSTESLHKIETVANQSHYPLSKINLLGYVDEDDLLKYCRQASFFVVPLWFDQKSSNRFPTKISTYMFCGKPILTCSIGEVGDILKNNENVVFFEPGNEIDLSDKIISLNDDKILYNKLCLNTSDFASSNFSYIKYSEFLKCFFEEILL